MAARLRVAYLTRDFKLAARESYEMLKVTFDDGDVMFLMREENPQPAAG
jgi:hypothetical protein